ncbi:MFS transporter [Xanthomonas melonis]|uniref:MFS-type drug efflux transporter P55 n=1 Tax=Xanthomonas melonis TaxID=56456 RepID=A0ABS8NSG8_9XANT|nr:MFS transporter [Xanthomonas melonis]MCD0257786.1 MFS transporter [Xanthomonas melonis]MCD0266004.1 MFS transporter [Xanthomonas melonis]
MTTSSANSTDRVGNPLRQAGRTQGAVLLLGSSLTVVGAAMIAPVLPKLGAEFGPVDPQANLLVPLVITGPALAIAVFAPVAGGLADRLGRKGLLVLATLAYALLGVLPALLSELSSIVGARLLFGCAEAAVMTCCTTLIADYWHGERRLRYINLQVICIALIGSLFFVVGGVLGEYGWRTPFYLYLLPLLLVPAMLRVLWEPAARHAPPAAMDADATVDASTLVVGYLLVFFGMLLSFIVPVQTPALLVGLGVSSSTLIGLSAGLGLLTTLGGSLLWPLLRRLLGIPATNAALLALLALGLWLLAGAQTYAQVLVAVSVHGLGAGLLVPNAMTPVMNALPRRVRGRGMGGFTSSLYLGQFASPLLIAALVPAGDGLHGAIRLAAAAACDRRAVDGGVAAPPGVCIFHRFASEVTA